MRTSIEQEALNDAKGAWKESLYTRHLIARLEQLKEIRLTSLIARCQDSSDPTVQRALGEYRAVLAQLTTLKTGDSG
jgi:hypothetical protein